MKKRLLMIATVALLAGCKMQAPVKEQIATVKTAVAEACGQSRTTVLPAKVRPADEVGVAFKVSGTLRNIPVREGQHVAEGEVIAEMDDRDYRIQFSATEAEYNQIKGEAERVINLYETNSVSKSDYEKAVYGLQQITAKYNAHRNALDDTKLRAPMEGYIEEVVYSRGATVGAGYPVIKMVSGSAPEVEVSLPAADFVQSDRFASCSCVVDLYPDRVFPLKIVGIGRKANLNGLYSMRLRFVDTDNLPTAGMVTTVTIKYAETDSAAVSIPFSAVVSDAGESSVWVLDPKESTVSRRRVEATAVHSNGTAVIGSGLKAGETVVSAGTRSLSEGMKVKPLAPKSATNRGGLL